MRIENHIFKQELLDEDPIMACNDCNDLKAMEAQALTFPDYVKRLVSREFYTGQKEMGKGPHWGKRRLLLHLGQKIVEGPLCEGKGQ